ncbi:uncharacterized protein STEHIDRAFT_162718 [Stereum hirsutum FP-91666 SS1]|uniref:MYND-type domain-containing protein n=1 Tax=Stereum hirsutum (strain FP-91666) TaxID=721885 RepID=R7RZM6_STEHR|nr:uncharacterized protein STEHIDRAFT_162718 [Stereum hirsutum FP-91666 SS1]EIM80298.1 hypothetical protein STEHIDRAFT_162718 [Stereum hirsutum FP-91666 SS1]
MPNQSSSKTKSDKKSKTPSTNPTLSNPMLVNFSPEFLQKVQSASQWQDIVDLICKELKLPDINTRSGLRRIHKDFDTIQRMLNVLYATSVTDVIAAGVVALFGELAKDGVLLERLIKEAGFLEIAVKMLDDWNSIRKPYIMMIIETLCRTICSCERDLCPQVAEKAAPMLMRLLEDRPFPESDRGEIALKDIVVFALSHCVRPLTPVEEGQKPSPVLEKLDTKRLTRLMVSLARNPRYFEPVFRCLWSSTYSCSSAFWATPSAIDFLVACTKSTQFDTRNSAILSLLFLYAPIEEPDDQPIYMSEQFMVELQQKLAVAPASIRSRIAERGANRSETSLIIQTWSDCEWEMSCIIDAPSPDWVSLGHKLVEWILRSEYIPNGAWLDEDLKTRQHWPCTTFFDTLPYCARVLRARTQSPEYQNKADILDIKYLILTDELKRASTMAQNSLKRSPEVAFFYHAASIGAEPKEGLRFSKKGLMCPDLTDRVRFDLLYRASWHALGLAQMKILVNSVDEGYAFAMSALEDSGTYIRECPSDSRRLRTVVCIHALSLMLVKGPELTAKSPELKNVQEMLDWVDEFAKFEGRHILRARERFATITLLRRLDHAWVEWASVLRQADAYRGAHPMHPQNTDEYLATLLDRTSLQDSEIYPEGESKKERYGLEPGGESSSDLYRCSWCGMPSAVLKRCKACEKARYCDEACQSRDWKGHKKMCGKKTDKSESSPSAA